jgi:hypothetical protein
MQVTQDRSEYKQIVAKTIRYCKACEMETPHEIIAGSGCVAKICLPCLQRSERYELDRD